MTVMSRRFSEYKSLDLPGINREIRERWEKEGTFRKSLDNRRDAPDFIFYEGPPSANGIPGIHHVMSRAIKDIFCRYRTLAGYRVDRRAGWDTHGLPIELSVETTLGITKEDIGKKISVEEFNATCKKEVMRYTREWERLTGMMGYWLDMSDPYITYDNRYIETLWYLLGELHRKGLLYRGYSIQPYSPAAGSGLSTHELNQPGCYRDVKDTTCVSQFRVIKDRRSAFLFEKTGTGIYLLAWTTTPWTLPSNTALAVGPDMDYQAVSTLNPYTEEPVTVILAEELVPRYFAPENENLPFEDYISGSRKLPWRPAGTCKGSELEDIRYEQLLDWVKPEREAFRVITGDFVTAGEGTGIVHIAPTFGADDYRAGIGNNIPPLIVYDKNRNMGPLVDRTGRFIPLEDIDADFRKQYVNEESYGHFAGKYVKNEYDENAKPGDPPVDVDIVVDLKKQNKLFRTEKYVHSYPHCWRTDKPVLYYPMDAWFIRTTARKDELIALNNTINWKPPATGSGRFGKWLENLQDWNLSRTRYWGTPLPIWVTEDRKEELCIGSVEQLKKEIARSVEAGFMDTDPLEDFNVGDNSRENYEKINLHRPFVDRIVLVSPSGKKMFREPDLIDGWFDSGAMPYAQMHYPFEHSDDFEKYFPADFIAEGVDQTRGWFFTLHAIAAMISGSVAYKNIVSNGLVLDRDGNKMSKRLGNTVDPIRTMEDFGADALRWYMITNAQPWDNLRFDIRGVDEVKRKFFGTLYNTYAFFALYANVDGFAGQEPEVPAGQRPEIDRWIISLLNSLVRDVRKCYEDYEPTRAGRIIQDFVIENLSNWYVRLNRKRFWGGRYDQGKISAYQTLYACLETVSVLISPIAPFYAEKLFTDLNSVTGKHPRSSVHLMDFPSHHRNRIDRELEQRMDIAQRISSLVLGLRRKVNIKVRQPLNRILIPVTDEKFRKRFESVRDLVLSEINVKDAEYISDTSGVLVRKIKPDFKVLGPKYGKLMKPLGRAIASLSGEDIRELEQKGQITLEVEGQQAVIGLGEVEIISEDIPGWLVANEGNLTVALDITVTGELREEGLAREFINRIQNLRKESGFDVTDKITVDIGKNEAINRAVERFRDYIGEQTLAREIRLVEQVDQKDAREVEIDDNLVTRIAVSKIDQ